MISIKLKKLLVEYHNNECEKCFKKFKFEELRVHRITRGGDYKNHRICIVVCNPCHKKLHQNEFSWIKSK